MQRESKNYLATGCADIYHLRHVATRQTMRGNVSAASDITVLSWGFATAQNDCKGNVKPLPVDVDATHTVLAKVLRVVVV